MVLKEVTDQAASILHDLEMDQEDEVWHTYIYGVG